LKNILENKKKLKLICGKIFNLNLQANL